MSSIPEAARKSFQIQAALIDEARDVLARTAKTMKPMKAKLAQDTAGGESARKS